jgi:hypothetical protein
MSSLSLPKSPSTDNISERFNERLRHFENINTYAAVKVLVVYWKDSDHNGFETEGIAIGEMFRNLFYFDVAYFAIPSSDNCFLDLDIAVAQALRDLDSTSVHRKKLLILHYGGHGDPNNKHHEGEEKRSVWAAYVSRVIVRLSH